MTPRALPSRDAECTGVRVGRGFGFVCAAPGDDTVVYRFETTMKLVEVARFSGSRFVSASGNGALVVRGPCADAAGAQAGAPGASEIRRYCILSVDGARREVVVQAAGHDLGAERVVALRDSRVVVLVPPRLGQAGKINVVTGVELSEHDLSFPKKGAAVGVARRGDVARGLRAAR